MAADMTDVYAIFWSVLRNYLKIETIYETIITGL